MLVQARSAARWLAALGFAAISSATSATEARAVTFILNDIGGVGVGTQARAGFEAAAAMWAGILADDVTIRLDVGFSNLGAGILGGASSTSYVVSYDDTRLALAADALSADDAAAVAGLPGGSNLTFRTNNTAGTVVLDANNTANNQYLDVSRANLKALGFLADDGLADAQIEFNNFYTYDFDPSNLISAGAYDFVGIAVHEIGHALGFSSGVDIVDLTPANSPATSIRGLDLNPYAVFSVLDLFRYSAAGLALGGAGTLDLATGGTPYFSLDGGVTNIALFSTGQYHGDGRQASHWKDNLSLGIMDPTAMQGTLLLITANDVRALDVIGWDLIAVPEPASLLLAGLGLAMLLRRSRRTDDA